MRMVLFGPGAAIFRRMRLWDAARLWEVTENTPGSLDAVGLTARSAAPARRRPLECACEVAARIGPVAVDHEGGPVEDHEIGSVVHGAARVPAPVPDKAIFAIDRPMPVAVTIWPASIQSPGRRAGGREKSPGDARAFVAPAKRLCPARALCLGSAAQCTSIEPRGT
jgi:hypothetical protein